MLNFWVLPAGSVSGRDHGPRRRAWLDAEPLKLGQLCKKFEKKGEKVDFAEVLSMIEKRDYQDSHREIAPLKPAADSVLVDTSELTLEQSAEKVMKIIVDKTGIEI